MQLIRISINVHKGNTNRKLISRIYSSLQLERGLSTMYIKSRWEKEANIKLTEGEWLNICRTQSTTSSSDLWRNSPGIHLFITSKIKKSHSNKPEYGQCWMCGNMSAGHFLTFWECPYISSYWVDVVTEIRLITSSETDFNFSVMYLGNVPTALTKQDRYLLQILLAGGKKAINRKWLSKESPTIPEWI